MPQYRLIGSATSPYVRRLRLYLDGTPCEFDVMNDMYGKDDARLSALNPLKRVPVLTVDGRPLWESRVIFNHLREALGRRSLDIEQENALSAVDTLQDQLVQTFLMKKFGHPVVDENDYFRRHADRRERMLAFLRAETLAGRFEHWDYPTISLFTLLDWADFRGTLAREEVAGPLQRVMELGRAQRGVSETDPRKA